MPTRAGLWGFILHPWQKPKPRGGQGIAGCTSKHAALLHGRPPCCQPQNWGCTGSERCLGSPGKGGSLLPGGTRKLPKPCNPSRPAYFLRRAPGDHSISGQGGAGRWEGTRLVFFLCPLHFRGKGCTTEPWHGSWGGKTLPRWEQTLHRGSDLNACVQPRKYLAVPGALPQGSSHCHADAAQHPGRMSPTPGTCQNHSSAHLAGSKQGTSAALLSPQDKNPPPHTPLILCSSTGGLVTP